MSSSCFMLRNSENFLFENGYSTPRLTFTSEHSDVIIRKINGTGSKGIKIIRRGQPMPTILSDEICTEFIHGNEYQFDVKKN